MNKKTKIQRGENVFTVSTIYGNFGEGYYYETAILLNGEFQEVEMRAKNEPEAIKNHEVICNSVEAGDFDYYLD